MLFYKDYYKSKYKIVEEEISLLQEIYFNSAFGPNQIKTNYLIDWEVQAKEVEMQEYFFNLKSNFVRYYDVVSDTKIKHKVPEAVEARLKYFEKEFLDIIMSCHTNSSLHQPQESSVQPKSPEQIAMQTIGTALTPVLLEGPTSQQQSLIPELDKKKKIADLLLGKKNPLNREQADKDHLKESLANRHVDSMLSLNVNLSRLSKLLRDINEMILDKNLKDHMIYIEVKTGNIVERASQIVKLKHQQTMQSKNSDEWDEFKTIFSDVLFDSRIYLSMLSKEFICHLVEIMPEHSIKELINATASLQEVDSSEDKDKGSDFIVKKGFRVSTSIKDSRPYKRSFNRLIRSYYHWMLKSTRGFGDKTTAERDHFYTYAVPVLKFFDRMILHSRNTEPTSIQPEIIYFDFLFAMYTYSNASGLLKTYSEMTDKSPTVESSFNEFFVRLAKNPSSLLPESMKELRDKGVVCADFAYLTALLSSMKLATNRFFTTEHSLVMKRGMDTLITDLLQFSKNEDISFDSKDGSTNPLKEERIDLGEGYLNLLFNEKQLQRDKNIQTFIAEATSNQRMENKYYYALYNLVLRLQTNLLYNTEESLLAEKTADGAWWPAEEKLIDLARNNLSPILSDCFLSKKDKENEGPLFFCSVKSATYQLFTMAKKLELTSFRLHEDNPDDVEKIVGLSRKLRDLKEIIEQVVLKLGCSDLHRIESINYDFAPIQGKPRLSYQNLLMIIFYHLEAICDQFKLGFDLDDFRRLSLYSDPGNLKIMSIMTKNSRKYNSKAADSSESYYKEVLAGRVEMEIDSRQLNSGLARNFIKIFNKMLLNQPNYQRRFRKVATNINDQLTKSFSFLFDEEYITLKNEIQGLTEKRDDLYRQREELTAQNKGNQDLEEAVAALLKELHSKVEKMKRLELQIENTQQFLYAFETNFFYNDIFSKAIVIYEKLLDEIPDLKSNIYNESFKNKGLINFEAKDKAFNSTLPYLHNLYTLSLQFTRHLTTSVLYNNKWGIAIGNLFMTLSLLNNLALDNFDGFKEIFANTHFNDAQLGLFREKDEESETTENKDDSKSKKSTERQREVLKPLIPRAQKFEEKSSFLVSICCRLQRFMAEFEFHDRHKLHSNFDSPFCTTSLSVLSLWLKFLSSVIVSNRASQSKKKNAMADEAMHYVYHKLCTRYLTSMLFDHAGLVNTEVVYLKRNICGLLFKLANCEENMEHLLKYQCDLRTIYDYTIKITKVHVAACISSDPTQQVFKWLRRNETKREETMKQNKERADFISITSNSFKVYLEKLEKARFSYLNMDIQPAFDKRTKDFLMRTNSDLFGGFMFALIKDKDHQKDLEKYTEFSSEDIMECYKKSDNRDLGFQFINSLVKLMGFIEYSTGLKLWSSKKENARVQFEVELAKLPKLKLYELKLVYFLSKINKQIEVIDQDGTSVLINFRKYPQIYTLDHVNPLELITNFKYEDFKRDVCKIIPDLYVKTSIQYNILQKIGAWFKYLKNDTTKKHPVVLWFFSLMLNFVIFTGYENLEYRDYTHKLRSSNYKLAETVLAFTIMAYSILTTAFWLSMRYYAMRGNKDLPNMSEMNSAKKSDVSNLLELKGILSFITDNPYFNFIFQMIFTIDTFSFLLHFVFAALGYFVNTVAYVGGICMFAFFNQTTRNLLKAIASNWLDIVLTLVLIFIVAYIFSILTFYYFFDMHDPEWYPIYTKPCITLYTCFTNTVNFGIRMGGGIGDTMKYMPESSEQFEAFIVYELLFFFLINSIGLNMLFGIIIDSFGNLREREWDIENDLNNNCLVCSIVKTVFETKGVDFYYHVTLQHNIEDYVSYMIRLLINSRNLEHDVDYEIFQKVLRFDNSWFPAGQTLFMPKSKNELLQADEKFSIELAKKLDHLTKRATKLSSHLAYFESHAQTSKLKRRKTLKSPPNISPITGKPKIFTFK